MSNIDDYWKFWGELIQNEDGSMGKDKTLIDVSQHYENILEKVREVYCHITGGRIPDPNTPAEVVIEVVDEHYKTLHEDVDED